LMFALRDNGGNEVIDDPNNTPRKRPSPCLTFRRGVRAVSD
jgi:hypothetical protein